MVWKVADAEKWIVEARAGSRDALGRLFELCRTYLLLAAVEELSPALRVKVAPSDLVQDTLLEAGHDFPNFRGASEAELLGWLRGVLRNNAANVQRHFETEKRRVDREVPLSADLLHRVSEPPETPSTRAQVRERDEQLERALARLHEDYRQVLLLRTAEGLTFAQVGARMGRSADAARMLWGRAATELSALLDTPT